MFAFRNMSPERPKLTAPVASSVRWNFRPNGGSENANSTSAQRDWQKWAWLDWQMCSLTRHPWIRVSVNQIYLQYWHIFILCELAIDRWGNRVVHISFILTELIIISSSLTSFVKKITKKSVFNFSFLNNHPNHPDRLVEIWNSPGNCHTPTQTGRVP